MKSVLLSENITQSDGNLNQCWRGWLSAVNDGKSALEKARGMDDDFWRGDPFAVCYTTYTYGYSIEQGEGTTAPRPQQAGLFDNAEDVV